MCLTRCNHLFNKYSTAPGTVLTTGSTMDCIKMEPPFYRQETIKSNIVYYMVISGYREKENWVKRVETAVGGRELLFCMGCSGKTFLRNASAAGKGANPAAVWGKAGV